MENFAFREFMKNDVVQKTIIFADAFNLNIDGWKPVNSEKYPYRINFYSANLLVGYIDIVTYEIGSSKYPKTDLPFVLFTPVGKIIGSFSTYLKLFRYYIEKKTDSFEKIEGLFEVGKYSKEVGEDYRIGSFLNLYNLAGVFVKIDFNKANYLIDIRKEHAKCIETVRLYIEGEYLIIEHFNFPQLKERQDLAKIKMKVDFEAPMFRASFDFQNTELYQKDIKINKHSFFPYWRRIGYLDYNAISEEIAKNDPAMFQFIDEVRKSLTMLANGIIPVSIYDKLAQLCFFNEFDKLEFDFTRAQSKEVALTRNLVLKRMDNHHKK